MAALARLLVLGGFPEATAGMESFLEIYEFGIGKFPSALEHQCTKKLPGPLAKLTCWKCKCFFFFFLEMGNFISKHIRENREIINIHS